MSITSGTRDAPSMSVSKPQGSIHAPLDGFIPINLALHNAGGKVLQALYTCDLLTFRSQKWSSVR